MPVHLHLHLRVSALPLVLLVAVTLATSCRRPPPPEPASCGDLYDEYSRQLIARPCEKDAECVAVSGLRAPLPDDTMGETRPPPCGAATHRDSAAAVETIVSAWRRNQCGVIGPPGSTRCSQWIHDSRILCSEGRCSAVR